LLDHSAYKLEGLSRLGGAGGIDMSYVHQTALNGVESQARTLQDSEEILLGDGTIGGMDEVPPATDGFLDLNLCLFADDQGIDQPIDLALDGLVRDRNFLGHGLSGLSIEEVSNLPAKP
jgi:hypothetical protein